MSIFNAPIVVEVREFKDKIEDANRRLKDLEELMRDLNNKLILQDMANASRLLGKKAETLRQRLMVAQGELQKISNTGNEMEGNTTYNEEEEFIDALKEEMPEVFKNIDGNFSQLDKIDNMLEQVLKTKSMEMMQELKLQIDDSGLKVEQCEGLVNKLENEIIEWDALKKLCRRDEELGEIDNLLEEFNRDLANEVKVMGGHHTKQSGLLASDPNSTDAKLLIEGIKNYLNDIDKLN